MPHKILSAKQSNWGLIKKGDWICRTWDVYSDRTYEIRIEFAFIDEESLEKYRVSSDSKCIRGKCKSITGRMNSVQFSKLKRALEAEHWRTAENRIEADDGEAWEIVFYDQNGQILNSSGERWYIYGERNLEEIVAALPKMDCILA